MEGIAARYKRLFVRGEGAERIAYYSDAVFAIAMTLLVVDLTIPDDATSSDQVLLEEWPAYAAFALSFVIIAVAWIGHHRRFRFITGHDSGLIWINFALLFVIASLPFPTRLMSEFAPEVPAVVLYGSAVALLQVIEMTQWIYCWRRGLLSKDIDRALFWYVIWDDIPVIVVFGASIVIAFTIGGTAAMYTWFGLFLVAPVAGVIASRRLDRTARAAEPA